MAALTALAVASIAASAFSTAKSLTQKTPTPPPAPFVPAPPKIDEPSASDIVTRIRRRGGAGSGRTATLLTGVSGIQSPATTQTQTLLGG